MRVVHFVNQFFGGLGGEEAAGVPVQVRAGAVGPAIGLQRALGDRGEVVATVMAGDNYAAEHEGDFAEAITTALVGQRADLLVAGPAFNAGRYGLACAQACQAARRQGVPAFMAMHPDNPAVESSRRNVYILPTGASAAEMRHALPTMAEFAVRLASGTPLGSADAEGYLPRGFRRNEQRPEPAATRLLAMLHAKLDGQPWTTEIPNQPFEQVPPAPPLADVRSAVLAVVTEAGVVPRGNPDHIKFSGATNWAVYGLDAVARGQVEVVHGGYDASFVNEDPFRMLPLDALRELSARGEIGGLLDRYYVTVGNGTPVATCAAFGAAIAQELKQAGVGGVVLPAT